MCTIMIDCSINFPYVSFLPHRLPVWLNTGVPPAELRLGVEPEVPTLVLQTLPDGTEEQAAAVTKGQRLAFALEARREEARVAKRARAGSAAGDDGGSAVDGARRRARRAGARQVLSAAAAAAAREKLTSGVKTVEEAHRSLMRASEELTFMSNLLGLVTGQQYFKVSMVLLPPSTTLELPSSHDFLFSG